MLGDQLCARARGQRPNVFLLYHTSSLKNLAVAVYWRGPQLGLSCEHLSMDFSGGLDFLIIWRIGYKEPASRTSWTDPSISPALDIVPPGLKGREHGAHFSVGGMSIPPQEGHVEQRPCGRLGNTTCLICGNPTNPCPLRSRPNVMSSC